MVTCWRDGGELVIRRRVMREDGVTISERSLGLGRGRRRLGGLDQMQMDRSNFGLKDIHMVGYGKDRTNDLYLRPRETESLRRVSIYPIYMAISVC